MSHDVIVIGAGMAGMTAGLRLAQEGLDVLVVSAGQGCLALAPGVVDVLGYTPQLVEAPARQLPAFIQDHPEHPYANLSVSELGESLDWFKEVAAPLGYTGSLEHNQLMPTGLGALRPTALVPETMAAGNLVAGGSVLVVGLTGYRDFYPNLIADNLSATALPQGAKISARAVEVGLSGDPNFWCGGWSNGRCGRPWAARSGPSSLRRRRWWRCRRCSAWSTPTRSGAIWSRWWEGRSARSRPCPLPSPGCGSSGC
jgi:choline dehydrogenase-like flavoprotein